MRIFQVLEASTNAALRGNLTWMRNLYEPLLDLGHDVFLFPAEEGRHAMIARNDSLRSVFSQKLLDAFSLEHARKPFDLFFAYLMDGMVDPGVIEEIRKKGVVTTNFSCNNAHQFYLVKELSPHFDFNLHSEKDSDQKFKSIDATSLWWPMASNPKYFKPQNLPRNIDLSFVGGNYGIRARYIHYLLRNNINIHVYGPGWYNGGASTSTRAILKRALYLAQSALSMSATGLARASAKLADHDMRRLLKKSFPESVHLPVSDEELISLYSKSKISLGFLEVYDNHDPSSGTLRHVHLREFEAPMCGALYCTSYSEELAELFEPEKEIVTYNNEGELLSKVQYYLKHQDHAKNIRIAGHRRAMQDHTYHKRFNQLFLEIGLR